MKLIFEHPELEMGAFIVGSGRMVAPFSTIYRMS